MATSISERSDEYDVVIMGGGPAGSTLAAMLCRETRLRVAVFDREIFPREHIGESGAHPLVPVLQASGALEKVLASECWIKKFGGIYQWDNDRPFVGFFEHSDYLADGVHRWTIHINRAEFDTVLLDHAESCGAHVFQGERIVEFTPGPDVSDVRLEDGTAIRTRYFVDASGRREPDRGARNHTRQAVAVGVQEYRCLVALPQLQARTAGSRGLEHIPRG